MGNYISCTLLSAPGGRRRSSSCAQVIFPGGGIRQFPTPTKAAELMLEAPNFFLVNSQSLHIGRRFSALNADEDLEAANMYVMFPMKRLNSVVTAADMGPLFFAASSSAKRVLGSGVRVLPESGQGDPPLQAAGDRTERPPTSSQKLSLEEIEGCSVLEFSHRLSMSRSKKPVLETIAEEPIGPKKLQHYITRKLFVL